MNDQREGSQPNRAPDQAKRGQLGGPVLAQRENEARDGHDRQHNCEQRRLEHRLPSARWPDRRSRRSLENLSLTAAPHFSVGFSLRGESVR
jgi:hypothetical protein